MTPGTPFLCVDLQRLLANLDRTAAWSAEHGLALRPHAKTHKSPALGRLQLERGAVGLTVATVGEAELFADHGVTDVFIAYPLWLDAARATRVARLADRVRLTFGVDSIESAQQSGRLLRGVPVGVLVEVDSGQHRTGVAPHEVHRVAGAALDAGLSLDGIFTFPGHSYGPGAGGPVAADEARALGHAASTLALAGHRALVVSGGSTPSLAATHSEALTEVRPGVYVFGDAQQWELGTCSPEEIALTCCATVVSRSGGRFVVDAGSKILGADRPAWASGFGRLLDLPDARVVHLSEHHAVVERSGTPPPPLGDRVRLVPNHVCSAVNLVDTLYVQGDADLETWQVAARGRNS
jgi:D-serine deaminase-like pyridoxal phosphate-dependent protein